VPDETIRMVHDHRRATVVDLQFVGLEWTAEMRPEIDDEIGSAAAKSVDCLIVVPRDNEHRPLRNRLD
jgi:hypothetical protein